PPSSPLFPYTTLFRSVDALLFRLVDEAEGQVDLLFVQQGIADVMPQRLDERVGEAAADDDVVGQVQQIFDDADLVLDLGAADDGRERTFRIRQRLAQHADFL